ncbi:MAG: hypothetical protein WEC84_03515 [Candidatus Andersenbacteria bacterium]
MKNIKSAFILYLLVALFIGLIVGLVLQGVQTVIVLAVIALAGITAIIIYMNTSTPADEPEEKEAEALGSAEADVVLSKEEARKWLDDFLVEHQKYKK